MSNKVPTFRIHSVYNSHQVQQALKMPRTREAMMTYNKVRSEIGATADDNMLTRLKEIADNQAAIESKNINRLKKSSTVAKEKLDTKDKNYKKIMKKYMSDEDTAVAASSTKNKSNKIKSKSRKTKSVKKNLDIPSSKRLTPSPAPQDIVMYEDENGNPIDPSELKEDDLITNEDFDENGNVIVTEQDSSYANAAIKASKNSHFMRSTAAASIDNL